MPPSRDIVDRTRLQVIRADELLNRTMDRIEETSDVVHRTVVSPVRQLSGSIQGLTAGLEFLLGGERRSPARRLRSAGRNVHLVIGRQSRPGTAFLRNRSCSDASFSQC